MHTVKSLRDQGYRVRVRHCRQYKHLVATADKSGFMFYKIECILAPLETTKNSLCAKGGETHIDITDPNGISVNYIAKCNKLDSYNKKTGVRIALGRAMKLLELERKVLALEVKENIIPFDDHYRKHETPPDKYFCSEVNFP